VTLDRPDLARRLTVVPYPRRIPTVLSVKEVTLLLRAVTAPKYKAAFAIAYGAGLRVSEVVALKAGDIDSERMLLRVERDKGGTTPLDGQSSLHVSYPQKSPNLACPIGPKCTTPLAQ
jgi:site-specific recombinase XerD